MSFLFGSIPVGYLIGQMNGIDIRKHGSGNIGATNVLRVLGKKWGYLAFAGDFSKGFSVPFVGALTFCQALGTGVAGLPQGYQFSLALAGVTAILGANYTPWLGFKGGKGIATSAGVLGALMPWVLVVAFSLWFVVMTVSRYVSVGSICASFILPIACSFFYPGQWFNFGVAAAACFLGAWRHRINIERLRNGTEGKVGSSRRNEKAAKTSKMDQNGQVEFSSGIRG